MDSYASVSDFLNQLQNDETVELSQQDNPEAILAMGGRIGVALINASSEINQFIGAKYSLPIGSPPEYLRYAAIVIARKSMDLYSDREKVRQDYDDVIKRLEAYAKGDILLVGADGKIVEEDGSLLVHMSLDCI